MGVARGCHLATMFFCYVIKVGAEEGGGYKGDVSGGFRVVFPISTGLGSGKVLW